MAEPTDEQLRDYAAKLPQIYKDLLAAIPKINPDRRSGDPVQRHALEEVLVSEDKDIRYVDIETAINQLVTRKFLSTPNGATYVWTTPLGERLISVISKRIPRPATIPELPQPLWAS